MRVFLIPQVRRRTKEVEDVDGVERWIMLSPGEITHPQTDTEVVSQSHPPPAQGGIGKCGGACWELLQLQV
jgi:hypothetical protein